jgi:RNA polymerase sigma factor (sigma-70 family)
LHEAINKLNPSQKEAIELYFFQQKDQEEAASILNITQSAFSKRLQRAIASLKDILGKDFY